LSCEPETLTDYQAYMKASPSRSLLVLNGSAESISAIDSETGTVYNNIQTVGHSGTNNAIPSDILIQDDTIYVVLSGQNSIESYNAESLDYVDDGRHYFENGYNPMCFIPVDGTSWIFCAGFETDELQAVNLSEPETDYSFLSCFEDVSISSDANDETQVSSTLKNAVGDNHSRCATGGAVLSDGSSSRLYVSNVRYDASILMTESDGSLAEYPADSGRYVQAPGYFREATISIFSFNADAMADGASDSDLSFSLVKEIDLESLFYAAAGSSFGTGSYFPGNGLNPQSVFILGDRLNVICTGTNGGSAKYYSDSEYIPDGYSSGDEKPGTNSDDGVIIVLDISDPDSPSVLTWLNIGGSPSGFRNAIDDSRGVVYLAGVGGIQSYSYGSESSDYSVLHSSSDFILEADNSESDYYSGLYYDSDDNLLYISFYSGDSVKTISVAGDSSPYNYSESSSYSVGDGPGALGFLEK
ncbi:MAG: hypothetical protein PQJ46_05340, partial [Spirochaetales bacterium]|nr:hypothetical protein [Spirochaetales bacterium]